MNVGNETGTDVVRYLDDRVTQLPISAYLTQLTQLIAPDPGPAPGPRQRWGTRPPAAARRGWGRASCPSHPPPSSRSPVPDLWINIFHEQNLTVLES